MITYIALLRGVNVGGHKSIAMSELRALCIDIGLSNVQTLLQSGNLVFTSTNGEPEALEDKLEKAVNQQLGLGTSFLIRTTPEWLSMIKNNPYPHHAANDPSHLALTLFKEAPSDDAWAALQSAVKGGETVHRGNCHAYLYYPSGIGHSRLTNALIEGKVKTRATARNWNTVLKLANLASAVK